MVESVAPDPCISVPPLRQARVQKKHGHHQDDQVPPKEAVTAEEEQSES